LLNSKQKQEDWEKFVEEIERNFVNNRSCFWKKVKGIRGKYGKKVRNVRNKNGKLITREEEILEVWRTHSLTHSQALQPM
jgi:hypothetical protein